MMRLLDELKDDENGYVNKAIRNLFAIGCYLHAIGETRAGRKACETALQAAKGNLASTRVDKLKRELRKGCERELAEESAPSFEIIELLRNKWPDLGIDTEWKAE